MVEVFLYFVFLYSIVWIFERKKRELDAFEIATAVIVPAIVVILERLFFAFIFPLPGWQQLIVLMTFVGLTFFVLNRTLRFPAKRAAGYTAAVFAFMLVVSGLVMGLPA